MRHCSPQSLCVMQSRTIMVHCERALSTLSQRAIMRGHSSDSLSLLCICCVCISTIFILIFFVTCLFSLFLPIHHPLPPHSLSRLFHLCFKISVPICTTLLNYCIGLLCQMSVCLEWNKEYTVLLFTIIALTRICVSIFYNMAIKMIFFILSD